MPDPDPIDDIRARHVLRELKDGVVNEELWCRYDVHDWPCDTAIVLAALDAAETSLRTGVAVHAELKVRLDAALERERRLREALTTIEYELGVPSEDYPAPVAEAYAIARAALAERPENE